MKKILIISIFLVVLLAISVGFCYFKDQNNNYKSKKTKVVHVEHLLAKTDIKDLVNLSDIIIEGKVIKTTPCDWANVIKTPLSDTNIKITKILRGVPYNKSEITVRTNHGMLNGVNYITEDSVLFKKHEKVLLFLALDDSDMVQPGKNYYIVVGSTQGKFSLGTSNKTSHSAKQSINFDGKKFNLSDLPALISKSIDKNYHSDNKSLEQIKSEHLKKVKQNQKLYKKYLDSKDFVVIY